LPQSNPRQGAGTPDSVRREMAGWLGFLLIALNLLLAPMLGYRPMAIAEDGITICTANGPQQLDSTGKPSPAKMPAGHFCAYCLPMTAQDGGFTAPAEIALAVPSVRSFHDLPDTQRDMAGQFIQGGHGRSPPRSV